MENKSNYKFFVPSNGYQNINLNELNDDLSDDFDFIRNKTGITSQPYILKIKNNSGVAIDNVKVLGANQNLIDPTGATIYGNNVAINITMGTPGIVYPEFLFQTINQVFTCGLVYLLSTNANQLLETYNLQYKDANGNIEQKTGVPILDPYQSNTRAIPLEVVFPVSGDAMITIKKLAGGATVRLYLYPASTINLRKTVAGSNPEEQFGRPQIIREMPVSLSNKAILALEK